jgi:anti-anti-sigma regulatory factor
MSMPPSAFPAPRSREAGHRGPDTIRVTEHAGVAVVTIRGGIDVAAVPVIRDVLGWAVEHHHRVVVDWSQAARIDRDGLGLLLTMQDRAHQRDVDLCFTPVPSALLAALRQLRAETLFTPGEGHPGRGHAQPADDTPTFVLPRPGPLRWQAGEAAMVMEQPAG